MPRENATGLQGSWDQCSQPKEIRVSLGENQARSQTQSRRGQPQQACLPSSGYQDRCAHGKQMFSGPECGAEGRKLGREEGERGEEPQLGNRMPVDVLLLFSILFIVESFKREQNGGGRCHNEASMLLRSSGPSPLCHSYFMPPFRPLCNTNSRHIPPINISECISHILEHFSKKNLDPTVSCRDANAI